MSVPVIRQVNFPLDDNGNLKVVLTSSGSSGTSNHQDLSNLSYASSGHTGFQPAGDYATTTYVDTAVSGVDVSAQLATLSGVLRTDIDANTAAIAALDDTYATDADLSSHTGDSSIHFTEASIDKYTQAEVDGLVAAASGTTDHSALNNLDYASSGHTGFQPAGDYATNSSVNTISGVLSNEIDSDITTHAAISDAHHSRYTDAEAVSANASVISTVSGLLDTRLDALEAVDNVTEAEFTTYSGAIVAQIPTSHTELSDIGSNTHAQIDTHISDDTKHRTINDSGSGSTDLWSAEKISDELDNVTISGTGQQGIEDIGNATDEVTVTLPTAMADANYALTVSVENTTDANPAQFGIVVTAKSTTQFTVLLSGNTDSANYKLNWRVGDDLLTVDANNLIVTSAPLQDHTAYGKKMYMTVDANSTGFGAALYIASDGNLEEADADSSTTMPCFALALEAGTGTKLVLTEGIIRDDSWNWTSLGQPVYISTTTGAMTQTKPSGTSDQIQVVGVATHADRIHFDPDYTIVGHA